MLVTVGKALLCGSCQPRGHLTYICACITRVCLYWLVLLVFFELDGDGDEPEVGEEGPVEPVIAGGGPAAAHPQRGVDEWLSTATLPRWRGSRCAALMNRSSVMSCPGVRMRQLSRKT